MEEKQNTDPTQPADTHSGDHKHVIAEITLCLRPGVNPLNPALVLSLASALQLALDAFAQVTETISNSQIVFMHNSEENTSAPTKGNNFVN